MPIFTFLFNNKNLIILLLLLGVIAGQYFYISNLNLNIDILKTKKEQIQTLLDVSQANIAQLQNEIKTQNIAIDQFKKDAEIRQAKNAAEVKSAQAIAETHKLHAEELLKKIAPQDMSKCDAANLIINEEIKNARK